MPLHAAHAADRTVTMSLDQQRTIGLATAPVLPRALVRSLHVPGRVEFDPGHVAAVRPLEQVRVLRVLVRPGDPVREGQALLLLLSPRVAADEAALPGAEAALTEATTGVAVARDAWHRSVVLAADGAMSRAEADTRRLLLAQAAARRAGASAEVHRLTGELARYGATGTGTDGDAVLRAPLGGLVVGVVAAEGAVLDPAAASPAVTVADLSEVVARAAVEGADAFGIAPGDAATVALADPGSGGRVWTGRVIAVGAAVDARSNTIPMRIALANGDGALKAGMFVAVDILAPTGSAGLTVPPDAIQIVGDRRCVFTPAGGDRFAVRDVTLGLARSGWTEVTKGLAAGDRVVTRGSFELKAVLRQSLLGGG